MTFRKLALAALLALAPAALSAQQMDAVPDRAAREGEGPFPRLLIAGATVIEGSGAPPAGPIDILVEKNRIAALYPGGAPANVRSSASKVGAAGGRTSPI